MDNNTTTQTAGETAHAGANTAATHTPGPWVVGRYSHACLNDGQKFNGAVKDRSGLWIASVHPRSPELIAEGEANARLIAAAPELLLMLDRVLHEYLLVDPTGGPICQVTLAHARAAIAKAKGGE